jgi:hypothetical protein
MRPAGLLQPLKTSAWISLWICLSLSAHKFDSIWVIVDRFTKTAHFIQVHTNYRVEKYVELYIARILCPHGVLKTIISDRGPQVVNCF